MNLRKKYRQKKVAKLRKLLRDCKLAKKHITKNDKTNVKKLSKNKKYKAKYENTGQGKNKDTQSEQVVEENDHSAEEQIVEEVGTKNQDIPVSSISVDPSPDILDKRGDNEDILTVDKIILKDVEGRSQDLPTSAINANQNQDILDQPEQHNEGLLSENEKTVAEVCIETQELPINNGEMKEQSETENQEIVVQQIETENPEEHNEGFLSENEETVTEVCIETEELPIKNGEIKEQSQAENQEVVVQQIETENQHQLTEQLEMVTEIQNTNFLIQSEVTVEGFQNMEQDLEENEHSEENQNIWDELEKDFCMVLNQELQKNGESGSGENLCEDEDRNQFEKDNLLKEVKILIPRLNEDEIRIYCKKSSPSPSSTFECRSVKKFVTRKRSQRGKCKYNFRQSTLNDENRLYGENLFDSDSESWDRYFTSGSDSEPVRKKWKNVGKRHCGTLKNPVTSVDFPITKSDSTGDSPILKKRKCGKRVIIESDEDLLEASDIIENNLKCLAKKSMANEDTDRNDSMLFVKNHLRLLKPVVTAKKLDLSNSNGQMRGCGPTFKTSTPKVRVVANNEKTGDSLADLFGLPDLTDDESSRETDSHFKSDSSLSVSSSLSDHTYTKSISEKPKRLELPNLNSNDENSLADAVLDSNFLDDFVNSNSEVFIDEVAQNIEISKENITDTFTTVSANINKEALLNSESDKNEKTDMNCNSGLISYDVVFKVQNNKLQTSHFKKFNDGTIDTKIYEDDIDPSFAKMLKSCEKSKKKKNNLKNNRVYYRYIVKELNDGRRVSSIELRRKRFRDDELLLPEEEPSYGTTPSNSCSNDDNAIDKLNDDDLYFDFDLADFLIKKGEEDLGLNDLAPPAVEEDIFAFLNDL